MARTKVGLSSGVRFSDFLSASLLARMFPAVEVRQALQDHGCAGERIRNFPADAAVYYTMALSLYPQVALEDVFASVTQGLAWLQSGGKALFFARRPPPAPTCVRRIPAWRR